MYWLKKMMQTAKDDSNFVYYGDKDKSLDTKDVQEFFIDTVLPFCHPFIFAPVSGEKPTYVDEIVTRLDAPFKVFSIEMAGKNNLITVSEQRWFAVDIACIVCQEVGFEKYFFYNYCLTDKGNYILVQNSNSATVVQTFLERLSTEACGVAAVNEKVSFKVQGRKKPQHIIKDHVFIVSQKKSKKDSCGFKEVDWTHRWEVRGHWMKLKNPNSIGKDRDGNYCIKGRTWRVAHEKGPEQKDLIVKQRTVKGE